jgi:predicted GNAT superfamily acetyltransferase
MTVARAWRAAARAAFLHYLPRGYRVTAFVPGHGRDATYLLSR